MASRSDTAFERLALGDAVSRELHHGHDIVRAAAASDVPAAMARKAAWLAAKFDGATRTMIGRDALEHLCPSHLEVVACLNPTAKRDLLRRAADERMTVRALRSLAHPAEQNPRSYGSAADLESATRAVETYGSWQDDDLKRLLSGPNAPVITRLAEAGECLAGRVRKISGRA
jgi:hypothetical protein